MIHFMKLYNVGKGWEGVASSSDGEEDDKDTSNIGGSKRRKLDEVCGNGCNQIKLL